jgi:hypothetical protein
MESGQERRKAEMSDTPRTASEWSDFASDLERENARQQMELDASCNAEELRQTREENARLLRRLDRLSVWRERMAAVVSPYLREDDGSDLIPDHVRVSNMLERIYSTDESRQARAERVG